MNFFLLSGVALDSIIHRRQKNTLKTLRVFNGAANRT